MYRLLCWIFLELIIVYPCASGTEPESGKVHLEFLQGDWLNKSYVKTLKSTKSPGQAVNGIHYTSFTISKEDDRYKWLQIYNFHEGLYFFITGLQLDTDQNSYHLVYHEHQECGRATENDRFFIPGKKSCKEIEWIFYDIYKKEDKQITFVRVQPNLKEYVNSVVISGTYTDSQGQTFIFSETGKAEWPDKTFDYEVGLDHIFSNCGYFFLPDELDDKGRSKSYAFEWRENRLLIFNISYAEEGETMRIKDTKPLYVLIPR